LSSFFCVILLTNEQTNELTNAAENITSSGGGNKPEVQVSRQRVEFTVLDYRQ